MRINPKLLNQSFDYYAFKDADTWSTSTYADEPITVNNVRIDENLTGAYNALAFIYASDTVPFIDFKRKSKIVTTNGTYIIDNIVKINEPFANKIWSVELELI